MYLEFYGLKEPPFSLTPDPRFVYLSERHRDALAHLLFGIGQGGGGGFVQLTGEVGTGKTTLSRLLLEQLPENIRVALVLNPRLSPEELLQAICEELGIARKGGKGKPALKPLVDALTAYLLDAYAQGLRVVVLIDEAQELSREALEQVRLLTNLETPTQKLLQIILLGQPELRERLARPDLRQLAQRITARYHLTPLDSEETEAYLRHRLSVAGNVRFPFTKLAVRRLHKHSGGVPRLINIVAERALLAGYARDQAQIGERLVDQAAREALAPAIRSLRMPRLAWSVAVGLVALVAAVWFWPGAPAPAGLNGASERADPVNGAKRPAVPYLDPSAFAERLDEAEGSDLQAWNRLLALWRLRAEEADANTARRCPAVLSPGVFCLRANGSLSRVAALGRPAILPLIRSSRTVAAIVIGLDVVRVRLVVGGETFDVDRIQLERYWRGEFHVVWRGPDFISLPLRRGDSGPAVDWLAGRLASAGGDPSPAESPVGPRLFDTELEASVRAWQARHGLSPDGIVGPETLLVLVAGPDAGASVGPALRRQL